MFTGDNGMLKELQLNHCIPVQAMGVDPAAPFGSPHRAYSVQAQFRPTVEPVAVVNLKGAQVQAGELLYTTMVSCLLE